MVVCNEFDCAITDYPTGTGILAFRDLKQILSKHTIGNRALDYGCGTGRSSRILRNLGFIVTGGDISRRMLDKALNNNCGIDYFLILEDGKLPFNGKKFDLILLSFVLMEIESPGKIIKILIYLKSLLAYNGKIVIINTTDNFYTSDWLSIKTHYVSGTFKPGQLLSINLVDYDININDYYWPEDSCNKFFVDSGLTLVDSYHPLGLETDSKDWKDEYKKAPFVIYVLTKAVKDVQKNKKNI